MGRTIPSDASFCSTEPAMAFPLRDVPAAILGRSLRTAQAGAQAGPLPDAGAASILPRSSLCCVSGLDAPETPASMTFPALPRLMLAAALAAVALPAAAAPADGVSLAPHRAVYDLKLVKSHGSRGLAAVRGRILYDFSGNACDGYDLKFRQVSELDSGEGKTVLSDLNSTTWEDADAKAFRFSSQNRMNEQTGDVVNGEAERRAKAVAISLTKPKHKALRIPPNAVFPTEHMRRIIAAARAGTTMLELPVYDGSETGEKLYNTFTLIGKAVAPGEKPPADAGAKVPALAKLTRWPVTISYFDQLAESERRKGEQTPVYVIAFELYENGISRKLVLYYPDFTISGEMTSLEMKKEKPCK
jgi:hypothetical protein